MDPQLTRNTVKVTDEKLERFIKGELEGQLKQKPNKKFLGLGRLSVTFYRWGDRQQDSWWNRFKRNTLGSPPVKLDSSLIESTVKSMRNVMRSRGYFYPDIHYEVHPHYWIEFNFLIHPRWFRLKGRYDVKYLVRPNRFYRYSDYRFHASDRHLFELLQATRDQSLIKIGHGVDRETMLKEQNRVNDMLRNEGYFLFNKNNIDFELDTARNDYYAYLTLNIKNRTPYERHRQYNIGKLTFQVDPVAGSGYAPDSLPSGSFTYIPNGCKLNPMVLSRMNFLNPGEIFMQNNMNRTYGRLSELQLFRSINIVPTVNESDSQNTVDFFVQLKQLKRYDFQFEIPLITSDQGNVISGTSYRNYGFSFVPQLTYRNVFRNAELLQFRYRASFEAQRGENIPDVPFFNSFEQSVSATVIVPQLLFLGRIDRKLGNATTKTIINTSVIYEQNVDYIRRVFTLGSSYQVSKSDMSYYVAFPEISYIRTTFQSASLEQRSQSDIFLQNLFASNLIVNDIRFGFTYTNQVSARRGNFIFVRWDVLELAGNLLTAANNLLQTPKNAQGNYELFGVNYFQYAKSFIDFRFNNTLDFNNILVYRAAFGYGLPYGNSRDFVPFEKRFFTGGVNSLRAFRPRSIGPGTYSVSNQVDRSGEVKVELNVEYRFNIYKHILEGAVFTDAGNVWTARPDYRTGAAFHFDTFYEDLAVGSGLGLRFNFNVFIFRLDAAAPLHDPTKVTGKRWVVNDYNSPGVVWGNTILNFGVGYPF